MTMPEVYLPRTNNRKHTTTKYSYASGVSPASQYLAVGLGASVSANYYNNPGSSIVTADVTFSDPVVTP